MSDLLLRRGDCFQHFEIWQKRQLVSFEIFCWHSQKKKDPSDLFSSNMYKGCKRLKCSKPMSFSQVFLKNEQMISVSLIPFFFFFCATENQHAFIQCRGPNWLGREYYLLSSESFSFI